MAKPILTVLFILSFITTAIASDCSEAKDTVSMIKCCEQRYRKADQELNTVYNEAMRTLPDIEKQKLKEA
jgi:uncharacterized protein YecT (DUF1311 family)